jgi:hypothetical protein
MLPGAGVSARVQIEASRAVTATMVAKRVCMELDPNYAGRAAVEMVDEIAGVAQYDGRDKVSTMTDYRI